MTPHTFLAANFSTPLRDISLIHWFYQSQEESFLKCISVCHRKSLLYSLHCIWIVLCCCHFRFNLEIVESDVSDVSDDSGNEGEGQSESELEGAGK